MPQLPKCIKFVIVLIGREASQNKSTKELCRRFRYGKRQVVFISERDIGTVGHVTNYQTCVILASHDLNRTSSSRLNVKNGANACKDFLSLLNRSFHVAFVDVHYVKLRLAELAGQFELEQKPNRDEALSVLENYEDILEMMSTPGRRYLAADGKHVAATKIQATWRRSRDRKAYLQYRRKRSVACSVAVANNTRCLLDCPCRNGCLFSVFLLLLSSNILVWSAFATAGRFLDSFSPTHRV